MKQAFIITTLLVSVVFIIGVIIGNTWKTADADEVSKIVSEAVNRVSAPLKTQIENLELKLNQPAKTEDTKQYTRAQLTSAVTNEKISQSEADAIWDKQLEKRTTDTTLNLIHQSTQEQKIQLEIDKYTIFDPDLTDRSSIAFQNVKNEVEDQCQLLNISQVTLAVELNALKALYGPSQRLKKLEQRERETHQDTTTNDSGEKSMKVELNDDSSPEGLSKDEKIYYQDLINEGIYTSWKAVVDEMKYANPRIRSNAAARG